MLNIITCFQTVIDSIIQDRNLSGYLAYTGSIAMGETDNNDHDKNHTNVLRTTKNVLILNKPDHITDAKQLKLLSYEVFHRFIKPMLNSQDKFLVSRTEFIPCFMLYPRQSVRCTEDRSA